MRRLRSPRARARRRARAVPPPAPAGPPVRSARELALPYVAAYWRQRYGQQAVRPAWLAPLPDPPAPPAPPADLPLRALVATLVASLAAVLLVALAQARAEVLAGGLLP